MNIFSKFFKKINDFIETVEKSEDFPSCVEKYSDACKRKEEITKLNNQEKTKNIDVETVKQILRKFKHAINNSASLGEFSCTVNLNVDSDCYYECVLCAADYLKYIKNYRCYPSAPKYRKVAIEWEKRYALLPINNEKEFHDNYPGLMKELNFF